MRRPETILALLLLLATGVRGAPYLGTEIGPLLELAHAVKGTVHAVDDRTLFIRGFTYDGQGPDAFFWAGSSTKPDGSGFIIPDEKGKKTPLRAYSDEDVLLRLPAGKTLRDIKWIAVWCRKFTANFGWVRVGPDLSIPAPVEIGALAPVRVSSGPVMVVDTHTLLVPDFTYDGKGPAAYFWASRGSKQHPRGIRLADENGSLGPLSAYSGKTVVISLPPETSVHDVDWFGVWGGDEDFGSVRIPPAITVPPSPRTLGIELEYKLNCEVLRDDLGFEVRWIMDGEDIVLQMVARLERGQYMSFGLSKNDSHSAMEKADAIVAWMDKKGKGRAVDYHLDDKQQCTGRRGSCPDVKFQDGHESVTLLNAAQVNGYTMVTVKRPQVGMDDKYDQHVYSDGPQAVVWAIGPLNDKGEVSYHAALRSEGDIYIDFARSPQWNCPQPADPTEAPAPTTRRPTKKPPTKRPSSRKGWRVPPIVCPSDKTFRFQIGPSGGKNGYQAITGSVGWGVAWYVNGLLLPELTVERGSTYTFVVEGGDDPDNPARTHPLYVAADDPEGGLEHKTPAERKKVRVLAGVSEDRRGKLTPTAKGRLCEWRLPSDLDPESFPTFDAFQENLELRCERGRPARFSFRPDNHTPDTLYYQCFTHRHLGWKIRVVDSCDSLRHAASVQHVSNVTYNAVGELRRGAPPADAKEKRRFTPTAFDPSALKSTDAPRTTRVPHPPTMESFHLRDVVHRYSQPNLRPHGRHRHTQVSQLKDALNWWNADNKRPQQPDHTPAASQHRPRQQAPPRGGKQQQQQAPSSARKQQPQQKSVVPMLLLASNRAPVNRKSPLVPLVFENGGRHVISLLGGGGKADVRIIRLRRSADHHDHHKDEDKKKKKEEDDKKKKKKKKSSGVTVAPSIAFHFLSVLFPLFMFLRR